jgi:hypothetical protein
MGSQSGKEGGLAGYGQNILLSAITHPLTWSTSEVHSRNLKGPDQVRDPEASAPLSSWQVHP